MTDKPDPRRLADALVDLAKEALRTAKQQNDPLLERTVAQLLVELRAYQKHGLPFLLEMVVNITLPAIEEMMRGELSREEPSTSPVSGDTANG